MQIEHTMYHFLEIPLFLVGNAIFFAPSDTLFLTTTHRAPRTAKVFKRNDEAGIKSPLSGPENERGLPHRLGALDWVNLYSVIGQLAGDFRRNARVSATEEDGGLLCRLNLFPPSDFSLNYTFPASSSPSLRSETWFKDTPHTTGWCWGERRSRVTKTKSTSVLSLSCFHHKCLAILYFLLHILRNNNYGPPLVQGV